MLNLQVVNAHCLEDKMEMFDVQECLDRLG